MDQFAGLNIRGVWLYPLFTRKLLINSRQSIYVKKHRNYVKKHFLEKYFYHGDYVNYMKKHLSSIKLFFYGNYVDYIANYVITLREKPIFCFVGHVLICFIQSYHFSMHSRVMPWKSFLSPMKFSHIHEDVS